MSDALRFKARYRIPSARLAGWDYRWAGIYSVTICTRGRACWFGEIKAGQVELSPAGRAVAEEWRKIPRICLQVTLDEWIVMPDHIHGVLVFQGKPEKGQSPAEASRLPAQSLGAIISQFKSKSTKRIRRDLGRPDFAWQTRFHDTILRDPDDLERVRAYIRANPSRWKPSTDTAPPAPR
ncbi:MAG TPA: transposase [Thermoanaerobaculia bacterium]|nr:transposase [Thermoanaerobaculia bacterium]